MPYTPPCSVRYLFLRLRHRLASATGLSVVCRTRTQPIIKWPKTCKLVQNDVNDHLQPQKCNLVVTLTFPTLSAAHSSGNSLKLHQNFHLLFQQEFSQNVICIIQQELSKNCHLLIISRESQQMPSANLSRDSQEIVIC